MSKSIKKKPAKGYNGQVLQVLEAKYGVSNYYIRQCVAGRRDGVLPDQLKKEYKQIEKELNAKLEELKQVKPQ